jgi:hypothetical protein
VTQQAERDENAQRRQGFLHLLVTDYRALASLVGLLVYGVVRVAYDAYYTRLGVFPEAVGLSETTILGRAVLYLGLTVSVAAIFGGLWLVLVRWLLTHSRAHRLPDPTLRTIFLGTSAVLALGAAGLVAGGDTLRSLLGSNRFTYYCFERCKFSLLRPDQLAGFRAAERRFAVEHPGYHVLDLGPAWLVAIPLGLVFLAAVAGLVLLRTDERGRARVRAGVVLGLFAAASMAGGLLAPHLLAAGEGVSGHDRRAAYHATSFVDAHPSFLSWGVFVLVLFAVGLGLLAVLDLLIDGEPMRSPWLIASFVAVVPLLLGFREPVFPRFVEEEGAWKVAAAAVLWVSLMAVGFWLRRAAPGSVEMGRSILGLLLAVIVTLTLLLAWERGLNLAKQAAMGDQILAKRFSLLSVRANAVCLEPKTKDASLNLPARPYMYLGETGGTLVLYDYVRDLANDVPTSFPLRMPSSDVVVRLAARVAPGEQVPARWVGWSCPRRR